MKNRGGRKKNKRKGGVLKDRIHGDGGLNRSCSTSEGKKKKRRLSQLLVGERKKDQAPPGFINVQKEEEGGGDYSMRLKTKKPVFARGERKKELCFILLREGFLSVQSSAIPEKERRCEKRWVPRVGQKEMVSLKVKGGGEVCWFTSSFIIVLRKRRRREKQLKFAARGRRREYEIEQDRHP